MSESSYKNRCFINPSIGPYYLVIIWAKICRIEEIGTVFNWYTKLFVRNWPRMNCTFRHYGFVYNHLTRNPGGRGSLNQRFCYEQLKNIVYKSCSKPNNLIVVQNHIMPIYNLCPPVQFLGKDVDENCPQENGVSPPRTISRERRWWERSSGFINL